MKVTYLVLITALLPVFISNLSAKDIDATILVNFTAPHKENLAPISTSDYRDFAPDVDVTAPINHVSSQANNAQLSARGLHNAKITVHSNNNWNTSRGHFIDTAILDSYLFASLKSKPLGNEVTISGLGDIPNGQEVTLTLWGTGDSENSDTNSL